MIAEGPSVTTVPEIVIADPPAVIVCPPTTAEAPFGAKVIVWPAITATIPDESAGTAAPVIV